MLQSSLETVYKYAKEAFQQKEFSDFEIGLIKVITTSEYKSQNLYYNKFGRC